MPVPITLTSPLAPNDLLFESMNASGGLSAMGELELGLLSDRPNILPEDLLGKSMTVTVQLRDGAKRYFHGYCTRFAIGARRGRYFGYHATVRPWLWFLTRTSDCKIFQDMTVPDIVQKVFQDHPNAKFELKLFRTYRKWVYCVQYRESDYNFVARLLEHEGIYWYVEHGDGQSKLVLVDSQSAHDAAPGCESLPYVEGASHASPDLESVSSWHFASEVSTDKVTLASFDFERPSVNLTTNANKPYEYAMAELEMFDFQGDYVQSGDGSQWAEDRLDEYRAKYQVGRASSNAHGVEVGRLLALTRHPRDDQNAQYLVTGISVHASVDGYETGQASGGEFHCDFQVIPAKQQFRPERRTPKPFVQGPQTAVVVGPGGEELFTDKHGRVKVQFHWDRYGQKNETSSCWIRVSQPWAGKGWGGISIPRMGQEVIVDFLEGDPDQPLVTGRVYNGDAMPPYALPAGAVVSGMKSQTHKGAGSNEMSMDDTAGKEKMTLHAQYDMSTTVEHDQTNTVNNKFTETIKSDAKITVTNGTYSHDVAANTATYHVQGALKETYDATQTTVVKSDLGIASTGGSIAIVADSQHIYVQAATSIQLVTGASKLWMGSDGNISLEGVNVTIKGSSGVFLKGGVVHSEADSEHQTKGAVVLSEGSATNTVKGGMVMLNP